MVDLTKASANPQRLILSMLYYGGSFGNTLFFLSSAWFLLDRKKNDKPKALQLVADNQTVSISILCLFLLFWGRVNGSLILKSVFPFLFENNWYVNCYVLFLLLYPLLNRILDGMDRKALARTSGTLTLIYLGAAFGLVFLRYLFGATSFFGSHLITWITIYYLLGYFKQYMRRTMDNRHFNFGLIVVGIAGTVGMVLLSNILGIRSVLFDGSLLIYSCNYNPFIIMVSLGLFNLARNMEFKSRVINNISGLSLYIYIIHENLLVRRFLRPAAWNYIYKNYGYGSILAWTMAQVAAIFVCSLICSIIYRYMIHPLVVKACNWQYPKLTKSFHRVEEWFLSLS